MKFFLRIFKRIFLFLAIMTCISCGDDRTAYQAPQGTLEINKNIFSMIEAVFQSLSCINGSFLYANEKRFLTGDESNSGINMDDVMAMFQALADSSDKNQYGEIVRLVYF